MSEFQELIKSISKSREYVRDFYIYGFKSREDFDRKSPRTYDNERRRIESWLSPHIKSEYSGPVKNVYLTLNSNMLDANPLYRVYEAKSFTDNDILLHFYILDILQTGGHMTADELTDEILSRFETDMEVQLVRKKANEYVAEGILCSEKHGKKLYYFMSRDKKLSEQALLDLVTAISFYQLDSPVGFPGYSLMQRHGFSNDSFLVKHGYFVHALEEEILLKLLMAMHEKREVHIKVQSNKNISQHNVQNITAFPLKVFVSTRTGRRFLCIYLPLKSRLTTVRLDHIKEVSPGGKISDYDNYQDILARNLSKCFGLSFSGSQHMDTMKMTLRIMEPRERFILRRLETEGRGGTITRIADNTYTYEISVFDGNEMMPWIKTFLGRIISFESNNEALQTKYQRDMEDMMQMYRIFDIGEEKT